MKHGKLTEWLEIGATLSVLGGVLLLVQEIRINTNALYMEAAIDNAATLSEPFFESVDMQTASEKIKAKDGPFAPEAALRERYDLTAAEAVVWNRHLMQVWALVNATYHHQDEELALSMARTLLLAADNRTFVRNYRWFDAEFTRVIDGLLAELDDAEAGG